MRSGVVVFLQDAVRGDHREIGRLLMQHGGKVLDKDGILVDLSESHLSLNISLLGELEPDWEIDPKNLSFVCTIGTHSQKFVTWNIALVMDSLPNIANNGAVYFPCRPVMPMVVSTQALVQNLSNAQLSCQCTIAQCCLLCL